MPTSFTLAVMSVRGGSSSGSVLDNSKSLPTQSTPAK